MNSREAKGMVMTVSSGRMPIAVGGYSETRAAALPRSTAAAWLSVRSLLALPPRSASAPFPSTTYCYLCRVCSERRFSLYSKNFFHMNYS